MTKYDENLIQLNLSNEYTQEANIELCPFYL